MAKHTEVTSVDATAKALKKKKSKGKRSWKMFGAGAGTVAALATTRALDATWRTATGRTPPQRPESPEIAGREALVWAALSGMAMGVARTYATRRAAQYWVRSTGELPPGMKAQTKEQKKGAKKLAAEKTA